MRVLAQLIFVVVLNAVGQLSLKLGSDALASLDRVVSDPLFVLRHPYFLLGGILYASSFLLYVNVLSQTRLSIAYPFIGLTYVIVVILSVLVLGESVGLRVVGGVLLVFAGVSLIGLGIEG